ncbi:hypothetical protein [Saccharothrix sp. ST-888]|uniref:hypothetical protein n=1 Tax=Saccharothrix sp. ST-888 TaxID=1427391 RepID=UPI0005EC01BF|nr:hypothetical protein [Saccharothrix sp. ST-888]KJK55805.1 hypothetical protein UK12_26400 [Saccharothrix sp. ST-888]
MRAASWQDAWTGGRRAVHLGNVADFNAQFLPQGPELRRLGHHYSCLAAFYTPHPALLVLPHQAEEGWLRRLAEVLAWEPVEVHSGIADEHSTLAEGLAARPALRRRIEELGLPVRPWGATAGPAATPGGPQHAVLEAVRRFESKAESHALFSRLAPHHPAVRVPGQRAVESPRRLVRLVREHAALGRTVVLKAPHGVGGYGTVVLTADQVGAAGGPRAALRALRAARILPAQSGILLEEHIAAHRSLPDLTFDGVIAEDGSVHPVGVAAMDVDEVHYRGATVGPGVVAEALAAPATTFGTAVGRELAEVGHRGWYDIDFVVDRTGRLAPTETNLRLTGPAVAFMLKARLDAVRDRGGHCVRTIDQVPVGVRLPQRALLDQLERVAVRCARLGATLLPTIPTAGFEELPTVGVALAARSTDVLTAAEAVLRTALRAAGDCWE